MHQGMQAAYPRAGPRLLRGHSPADRAATDLRGVIEDSLPEDYMIYNVLSFDFGILHAKKLMPDLDQFYKRLSDPNGASKDTRADGSPPTSHARR